MVLETGIQCKWEDIEVGEVFAWNGCWGVYIKTNKNISRLLSSDFHILRNEEWTKDYCWESSHNLYKLPMSIQRLWKEV